MDSTPGEIYIFESWYLICKPVDSYSVFQYEKFFRAQQRPKNLKREEWRAVGARLHQLHAKGLQTRIKVSGQICSKGKVDRALRHAFSDLGGKFQSTAGGILALPFINVTHELINLEHWLYLPQTVSLSRFAGQTTMRGRPMS